tara:strand:+ start:1939 stop:2160 length:222 start_codon:yes stop_codon:yes gene_type:complete
MTTTFKDPRAAQAYSAARDMHDTLSREGSGRGMAYRRGWNGHSYSRSWASWPVYAAGRDNRKIMGGDDLPTVT